jgi:ankyrin repeat protein
MAVVKLLIKAGARANAKDKIGGTPLSYAICNRHKQVIELLLKGDTQGDLEDISKELLLSATKKGDEDVVRLLLDMSKTNLDARDTKYGRTPLSWATVNGHLAIVKLLLATGKINVNAKDKYNWTPLSCAIEEGHENSIKLLLEAGAKVDYEYTIKVSQSVLSLVHASI